MNVCHHNVRRVRARGPFKRHKTTLNRTPGRRRMRMRTHKTFAHCMRIVVVVCCVVVMTPTTTTTTTEPEPVIYRTGASTTSPTYISLPLAEARHAGEQTGWDFQYNDMLIRRRRRGGGGRRRRAGRRQRQTKFALQVQPLSGQVQSHTHTHTHQQATLYCD